jgi:hypothetical protein
MWACPHCGAPQAEAARCWVCHRSSTTCSTCRHFRTSLAADVGYCGKDRWRTPLTGLEMRACWEEGRRSVATTPAATPPATGAAPSSAMPPRGRGTAGVTGGGRGPLDRPDPMRLRGFVPLDELVPPAPGNANATPAPEPPPVAPPAPSPALGDPLERWEARTSLVGDAER